jgi:hypothetical protein
MQSKATQFKKYPTVQIIKLSGLCESSCQLARTFRLDEPKSAKIKKGKIKTESCACAALRSSSLLVLNLCLICMAFITYRGHLFLLCIKFG